MKQKNREPSFKDRHQQALGEKDMNNKNAIEQKAKKLLYSEDDYIK